MLPSNLANKSNGQLSVTLIMSLVDKYSSLPPSCTPCPGSIKNFPYVLGVLPFQNDVSRIFLVYPACKFVGPLNLKKCLSVTLGNFIPLSLIMFFIFSVCFF